MKIKDLVKTINSGNSYIEPMYLAIYDVKETSNNAIVYTFAIVTVKHYPVKSLFVSSVEYDKNVSEERIEEEHLKAIINKLSALAITHLFNTDSFVTLN